MARIAQTSNDPLPSRVIGGLALLRSKHAAFFEKDGGPGGKGKLFFT